MNLPWTLSQTEIDAALRCLSMAADEGASDARISLNKSMMDLVAVRDGDLDKVSRSGDRALQVSLFVEGRFGTFSTNRLEERELRSFISKAAKMTRMLAPDPFRILPPQERIEKEALTGQELGLCSERYAEMTPEARLSLAKDASALGKVPAGAPYSIVSEEIEYSDSVYDLFLADSRGTCCRHTETSFEIGCETTILSGGDKLSGFAWDSATSPEKADLASCGAHALEKAAAQLGPKTIRSGRYPMVADREISARLLAPVLSALGGYAIEQKNSFLAESLGKKIFAAGLTVFDEPRLPGRQGSRTFDSEGVATIRRPIIEEGVVKTFFLNTYMAGKLGMAPTAEESIRATLSPLGPDKTAAELMKRLGAGIYVTGLNGGNSNSATGDFSYGVEGFFFNGGRIVHPVREVLVTGNFIGLWSALAAAGDDARPCQARQVPSLAFTEADFSA